MFLTSQFPQRLHNAKRSFFAFLSCLPTSLLALILLLLLLYNGFSVFYIRFPLPANFPPNSPPAKNLPGNSLKSISSSVLYAVKEETLPVNLKTQFPLLPKSAVSTISRSSFSVLNPKKTTGSPEKAENFRGNQKPAISRSYYSVSKAKKVINRRKTVIKIVNNGIKSKKFARRIDSFLANCKVHFFMTWISSLDSFGDRELFSIESLFKSNPDSCLVIVSNSMDSKRGNQILKPFMDKGFKLAAIRPDFDFIFKGTFAEPWFSELKKGNVDPGEVSLGQNLSNLARLALLYKFGGIYIDTDVIVLKSLTGLRNVIGAQTIDEQTGNWSRLNNAVLIFDKNHPLIFKFIQEFALTFDGNKWGHNGPYLVSRVVSRVSGRAGFDFTVVPPPAFYPVNWSRVRSLFKGPSDELHLKWVKRKLEMIKRHSFAVHLWNKQSRDIVVESGSVVGSLLLDCCIFCNSSRFDFVDM